jgi:hypothetical protein
MSVLFDWAGVRLPRGHVGRAPHSRFSQMAKAAAQAAAKELLERVLKEGIVIPGDEKQQHMRMGQVSVGELRKVSTLCGY